MATWRMLPPASGALQTVKHASGRSYTVTPGSFLDVPDHDVSVLSANGWVKLAESGATAARPTQLSQALPLPPGYHFYDTTLAAMIFWDGKTWRSAAGASV